MRTLLTSICALILFASASQGGSDPGHLSTQKSVPDGWVPRQIDFAAKDALADWKIAGHVAVDPAQSDAMRGGALRIGPGGKAVLNVRKTDGSGTVEMLIYDDGTVPSDPKVPRVGPQWGLVRSNGRVLAVGILYNSYLGGNEGDTATARDGESWRDYKTFTRIATDGIEGMLQAWRRMKLNRRDKPYRLACCQTYGAWLVTHQNPDGSYFRQYVSSFHRNNEHKCSANSPVVTAFRSACTNEAGGAIVRLRENSCTQVAVALPPEPIYNSEVHTTGGDRFRPDGYGGGGMPRTLVGLVNLRANHNC